MNLLKRIGGSVRYRTGIYRITALNFLRENMQWYQFSYKRSLSFYKKSSPGYSFKEEKISSGSVKTIAFIYSKKHFNPSIDETLENKAQFSASNISRQIFNILKGKKVFFFDHSEPLGEIPKVDLVLGIISANFLKIAQVNPQAEKVLFLVNSHPLYRLKALIDESRELGKFFPYSEYVSPLFFLKLIKHVDRCIVIGNQFVKNTFVQYGIPEKSLELIDTGANKLLVPDDSKRPKGKIRVIYVGSHLAIRKGLFRVMQAWDSMGGHESDFELVIIGAMDKFKAEMTEFLNRHSNVRYLGWIESNAPAYAEWLQSAHSILNLSIEEGQVGCVLDGMACGAIPVITEESGVEILDGKEGFIVKHNEPKKIAEKLLALKNEKIRKEMQDATLLLIKNRHSWEMFDREFRNAVFK